VPDTQQANEEPRRLLRNVVFDSLKKQAANVVVAADHIHVTGASYVEIVVEPTIVPVSLKAAAQAETAVIKALQNYIHPLSGGPHKSGWEFGKPLCRSEIFAVLERINDVDHVLDIAIRADGKEQPGDVRIGQNQLVFSGPHRVKLTLENGERGRTLKTLASECLEPPEVTMLDPQECS
jgi:hypothetical protein